MIRAGFALAALALPMLAQTLLVEAESFDQPGGWVLDQQFMEQMGSPFLLAHGMGSPVSDARTTVKLPKPGTYRVWVRTRDWVAPWKGKGAPGRFQVLAAGKPLGVTFGASGAAWHWQDGGTIEIPGASFTLTRTSPASTATATPPAFANLDSAPGGRRWRGATAEPSSAGQYDLVGGGVANPRRLSPPTKVALQDRRRASWIGPSWAKSAHPYPSLGMVVDELDPHRGKGNTARRTTTTKKNSSVVRAGNLSQRDRCADKWRTARYRHNVVTGRAASGATRRCFPAVRSVAGRAPTTQAREQGRDGRSTPDPGSAHGHLGDVVLGRGGQARSISRNAMGHSVQACRMPRAALELGDGAKPAWVSAAKPSATTACRALNWSFQKNHARQGKYPTSWRVGMSASGSASADDVILTQQDIEQQRRFPD